MDLGRDTALSPRATFVLYQWIPKDSQVVGALTFQGIRLAEDGLSVS